MASPVQAGRPCERHGVMQHGATVRTVRTVPSQAFLHRAPGHLLKRQAQEKGTLDLHSRGPSLPATSPQCTQPADMLHSAGESGAPSEH